MGAKVTITYCTSWGYLGRAVSLADKVLNEYKNEIEELILRPSAGGVFEISVNDKEVFSKLLEDRFPGIGEAESLIRNEIEGC